MAKVDVDQGKRMEKESEEQRQKQLEATPEGPTVLWRSAAKTVSFVTGVSSLAVRTGCSVGSFGLTIGREATQRTLSLNQTVLEMILKAAGKDVRQRSDVVMRHEAVENLLGKWVSVQQLEIYNCEKGLTSCGSLRFIQGSPWLHSWPPPVSTSRKPLSIGPRIHPCRD